MKPAGVRFASAAVMPLPPQTRQQFQPDQNSARSHRRPRLQPRGRFSSCRAAAIALVFGHPAELPVSRRQVASVDLYRSRYRHPHAVVRVTRPFNELQVAAHDDDIKVSHALGASGREVSAVN